MTTWRKFTVPRFFAVGLVLAVAVAVALPVTALTAVRSLDRAMTAPTSRLARFIDFRVEGATARAAIPADVAAAVALADPGVRAVPIVQGIVRTSLSGDRLVLIGVECGVMTAVGAACDPASPLVMSPRTAARFGERVTVVTADGNEQLSLGPASRALDAVVGGNVALVPLDVAQRVLGRGASVDMLLVDYDAARDRRDVERALLRAGAPGSLRLVDGDSPSVHVRSLATTYIPPVLLLASVASLIGGSLCWCLTAMVFDRRRRMIAVLCVLGARRSRVVRLYMFTSAALGAVGGGLGTAFADLLVAPVIAPIDHAMTDMTSAGVAPASAWSLFPAATATGAVIAAMATLVAAMLASRRDPIEEVQMRSFRVDGRRFHALPLLVASAPIVAGLLAWVVDTSALSRAAAIAFLLVGLGAVLVVAVVSPLLGAWALSAVAALRRLAGMHGASRALLRSGPRTRLLAASVGLATLSTFVVADFTAGLRARITDDLHRGVEGQVEVSRTSVGDRVYSDARLPEPVVERLGRHALVARVSRAYAAVAGDLDGSAVGIAAFENNTLPYHVLAGTKHDDGLEAGGVLVGPAFAERNGLRPGDRARIRSMSGWVEAPVIGVWSDGNFGGRNVTMSAASFRRWFPAEAPVSAYVAPAPGVTEVRLRAALQRELDENDGYRVRTSDELIREVLSLVDEQLGAVRALHVLFVVLGAVVAAWMLLTTLWERSTQAALLETIGMRRPAVGRMIALEMAALSGSAAALAAVFAPLVFAVLRPFAAQVLGFGIEGSAGLQSRMAAVLVATAAAGMCSIAVAARMRDIEPGALSVE